MTTAAGRRGVAALTVATFVAAAAGWLVLVLAARALGPAGYAVFAVFWGLCFGLVGTVAGVQHETTRAVGARIRGSGEQDGGEQGGGEQGAGERAALVLPAGLLVGVVAAVLVVVSGLVWGDRLFGTDARVLVAAAALGAGAFAGQAALAGALLGAGRWPAAAAVQSVESLLRLALVAVLVAVGATVAGLAVATGAAMLGWVVVALHPAIRPAARAAGDVALPDHLAATARTMVGTAATAVLVSAFPVLVAVTATEPVGAEIGVLLAAVLVTRAPLLVPLAVFQGALISTFVARRDRLAGLLGRATGAVAAVAALGGVAAVVAGPAVMRVAFGADYRVSGAVMGALVLAAGAMGVLTVTGAAVLSLGAQGAYARGWVAAAAMTTVLLLAPWPPTVRLPVALAAGPVVGVLAHLLELRRVLPVGREP